MLKCQLVLGNKGTETTEFAPIRRYPIERYGLTFTDKSADILIVHSRLYDTVKDDSRPKVIVERADSAVVYHQHVREALERDDVLAVIKTTAVRDAALHNSDVYSGRYHLSLVNRHAQLGENEKQKLISEKGLAKIKCLIPTSIQDRFEPYKKQPLGKRKWDVSFVGMVKYPGLREPNMVEWHRQQLIHKLRKLKLKVFVHAEESGRHTFKDSDYRQVLRNSRICLSPWGMGEWNYRDFQAMYSETTLIKPDSSHVKSYPVDIFKENARYIACETDFSDIEEKIDMVLSDKPEFLSANREALLNSWNTDKLASEFASFIVRKYDRS